MYMRRWLIFRVGEGYQTCSTVPWGTSLNVQGSAASPGTITMVGDPPEWEREFRELAPLRKSGRPADIADAVVYLATAEFLTGHTLVLDGGRTL